jgi:hydrogenase-4 component E
MQLWLDAIFVLIMLTNLSLLAASRMRLIIRAAAIQGVLLGLLPLLFSLEGSLAANLGFSAFVLGIKGLGFPWLLTRTCRRVRITPEIEPYIGYNFSVILGIVGLLVSLWLEHRLDLPVRVSGLSVSAAFMTIFSGFLLVVSRKKAVTQVIGYLAAENGIFLFGLSLAPHGPMWLELCVLLDIFVAVFVMGIAIHNIGREFDSVDIGAVDSLKD